MTCFILGNDGSKEEGTFQRVQADTKNLPTEKESREVLLSEGGKSSPAHQSFEDASKDGPEPSDSGKLLPLIDDHC